MTKFGETHTYTAYDFVNKLEIFIERQVDGIVCNTTTPGEELLERYRKKKQNLWT